MQKILATNISEKASLVPLPEAHEHAFVYSQFRAHRFHFYWHYHQEIELVFIRRGNGLRYVGRSVEPCGPGDLVLLGSNLPHTWGSASDQSGDALWTVVQFLPQRWGKLFWEMPETKKINLLLKRAECGIQFVGKKIEQAGRIMDRIEAMPPYSFQRLVTLVQLFELLLGMEYRSLNASPVPLSGFRNDNRLQQVLSLIDSSSHDKLSQSQVAESVHMDPAVFSRWFKQNMGRTFQRYLNEVRVAHVCAKLTEGEDSITAVAMNSGYHNLSNFNRRFLEITGMTPKDFRNKSLDLTAKVPRRLVLRDGLDGWLEISKSASTRSL